MDGRLEKNEVCFVPLWGAGGGVDGEITYMLVRYVDNYASMYIDEIIMVEIRGSSRYYQEQAFFE